ncbi:MAG: permease prefix domain 1-containing protein [Planctomycetaceae bacterium]|nr:permease prefix domain 1-containing protein [Planctomycetaceae bacterium]MDG2390006.1 permease prefix domain 1-containing protein [Planctomycetaceae bacterium]
MLRSDILDELNDHLQSTLEYEQIKGKDEEAARELVLSRFGNPSTIAC